MEISGLYQQYLRYPSITTDTRKILQSDIFFALKGPNFNGNNFAKHALNSGASLVVVDEEMDFTDGRIIKTENTLSTLQDLAKYHRAQFSIPFIAITGSNGKTTTKELIHEVLSSTYKTYTTQGNLNNHIGIPLTLLKIKNDAEIAVIEMGANNPGEIKGYCEYVKPTCGLITNFGKAHLEGFINIEGVRKAKSELFNYLKENDGTVFVNADDNYMIERSDGIKNRITYGTLKGSVNGVILSNKSFLEVAIKGELDIENIKTQLVGEYNLCNVLAAATIGNYFNIPAAKIESALESYIPSNSRSQMIEKDTNKIILDAYNANPDSMKAAIKNFAKMEGDNKILLLGAMMELGKTANIEHREIITIIEKFTWNNVVLVGDEFQKIENSYTNFKNSGEARDWFKNQHFQNSQILIKGSRSMQMEKILEL